MRVMNGLHAIVIVIILIIIPMIENSLSANIIVGKDFSGFTSIQSAVEVAHSGDTIEVHGGTYAEKIFVNKSLTIRGIANPVIDAGVKDSAITLSGDNIVLEGFVLKNSGLSGIDILGSNDSIKNNAIINCSYGIILDSGFYRISHSLGELPPTKNRPQDILRFNNSIENNTISKCSYGMVLDSAMSNTVFGNTITLSRDSGILLEDSHSNNISNNLLLNNNNGIILRNKYLGDCGPYGFSGYNIIAENVVQGSRYGVNLLYSEYNTINGNELIRNIYGIDLSYSRNNTLSDNYFIDNKANIASDGKSMRDFYNESNSRSQSISPGQDVIAAFFTIGLLVFILFVAIIGLLVGLIARKMLKQSSLSKRSSMVLGSIGALVGYFFINNPGNLYLDFLFAALFAAGFVIMANIIKDRGKTKKE